MDWRPAKSLVKLRDQINAAYPNRSKVSDGMIGDEAHRNMVSDHNPNSAGVVTAFDITHDPAHGLDIDKLSDVLAASRDPRIKYLIANGLILVPADYGWTWQPYSGDDPHTSHLHVSVYGDYDNTSEWKIGGEDMPYTDAQYNALKAERDKIKADRDQYAEDWAKYRLIAGGLDPSKITQKDRQLRLKLPWKQAASDLNRDLPIKEGSSPFELKERIDELKASPGTADTAALQVAYDALAKALGKR